jgi:hypothetical protein
MGGMHLMSVQGAESSWTTAYYDERALIYVPKTHNITINNNHS